jgi:hypothetical protein
MATNLDQPWAGDIEEQLPRASSSTSALPIPYKHAARQAAERDRQAAERDRAQHSSIWLAIGPAVLVLALLLLATAYAGAFAIAQWAPPALFVLIVLLMLVLRDGILRLPDSWLAVALAGAWGLAGWAALSASWAAAPAAALEGAGQLTFYAAILTLPLLAIGQARALRVAAHGIVVGIALIGLYALVAMFSDGQSIFLAGRLNGPIEYRNATALLFCLAYWPLIVLAAARGRGRLLRALCLGMAETMLGLAFLTQSRGVLLGLSCGAAIALLLGPDRVRRVWLALLSLVLLAGFAPSLLTPYHAFAGGHGVVSAHDIKVAAEALLGLSVVGAVVGFLLAVWDDGLRVKSPAMGRVRAGARVGLVAVALVALAGGWAAVHGNPAHELSVKWREFRSLESYGTSTTRYTSAEGQRYDLWRVAYDEFREHPLGGVGEGSYQFDYYRKRASDRNLNDPHGLLFQLAGELGAVGLLLFALIPLGLLGSFARWWRLAAAGVRREVGGLTAAGVTFIGQSFVDWMWHIPGLAALGMLCLGVAAALLARSAGEAKALTLTAAPSGAALGLAPSRFAGRLAAATLLLAGVALTFTLYLSDFYIRRARDELGHSPQAQLADARTASQFDPWSTDPHYLEASALESMGDRPGARAQLLSALRLEPTNQVPLGLLGDFEARGGHYRVARSYYRRALALNPLDTGLQQLARSGGRPEGS